MPLALMLLPISPVTAKRAAQLQETTLALTQKAGLLKVLLTSLLDAMRRGLGDTGRLEGDSPVMTGALSQCFLQWGVWLARCCIQLEGFRQSCS